MSTNSIAILTTEEIKRLSELGHSLRHDPVVRADGKCHSCGNDRPTSAVSDQDPFCSTECCQGWHGTWLPQLLRSHEALRRSSNEHRDEVMRLVNANRDLVRERDGAKKVANQALFENRKLKSAIRQALENTTRSPA